MRESMRDHPWHLRRPNTEQHLWFQRLLDIHGVTLGWVKGLKGKQPLLPHQLQRVASPAIGEIAKVLENLSENTVPTDLENLLDDFYPREFLERLERTIWMAQAWTLTNLFDQTPKNEHSALRNSLEQSSWNSGQDCFHRRWPVLPPDAKEDLRVAFKVFLDSPLTDYPKRNAFLVKRMTEHECDLEWLSCPHRVDLPEVSAVGDSLCALYAHWVRGFLYSINSQIAIDYTPDRESLCRLRWKMGP